MDDLNLRSLSSLTEGCSYRHRTPLHFTAPLMWCWGLNSECPVRRAWSSKLLHTVYKVLENFMCVLFTEDEQRRVVESAELGL